MAHQTMIRSLRENGGSSLVQTVVVQPPGPLVQNVVVQPPGLVRPVGPVGPDRRGPARAWSGPLVQTVVVQPGPGPARWSVVVQPGPPSGRVGPDGRGPAGQCAPSRWSARGSRWIGRPDGRWRTTMHQRRRQQPRAAGEKAPTSTSGVRPRPDCHPPMRRRHRRRDGCS
jgi:hypothetical protein